MGILANRDAFFQYNYTSVGYSGLESLAIAATEKKRVIRILQQLRNDLRKHTDSECLLSNRDIKELVGHFYHGDANLLPWEEVTYQTLVKIRIAAIEVKQEQTSVILSPKQFNYFLDSNTMISAHKAERFATLAIDYLYQLTSSASVWSM